MFGKTVRHVAIYLALIIFGAGCGDDTTGNAGQGAAGGDGGSGGSAGAPTDTFVVKWGPTMVPSGKERTQCVIKRLGNDGTVFINQIRNQLGATSHHFIVYEVTGTAERPEPYDCFPFTGSGENSKLMMITQKADDTLRLPPRVAYELEAGTMVRLELHYINVSAADQMAEATSTFGAVPEDGIDFRADIEFLGPIGFPAIKSGENATFGPTFVRVPAGLDDAKFFAITGHQHRLGTNVFVETRDAAGNAVQPVYDVEPFLWDEPETVTHDPPFTVPSGGGFNLTCDWTNDTLLRVGFGLGVNSEMCFFWAYYYQ